MNNVVMEDILPDDISSLNSNISSNVTKLIHKKRKTIVAKLGSQIAAKVKCTMSIELCKLGFNSHISKTHEIERRLSTMSFPICINNNTTNDIVLKATKVTKEVFNEFIKDIKNIIKIRIQINKSTNILWQIQNIKKYKLSKNVGTAAATKKKSQNTIANNLNMVYTYMSNIDKKNIGINSNNIEWLVSLGVNNNTIFKEYIKNIKITIDINLKINTLISKVNELDNAIKYTRSIYTTYKNFVSNKTYLQELVTKDQKIIEDPTIKEECIDICAEFLVNNNNKKRKIDIDPTIKEECIDICAELLVNSK